MLPKWRNSSRLADGCTAARPSRIALIHAHPPYQRRRGERLGPEAAGGGRRAFTDDLWIVAPAEEQSGTGHSLTLTRPVRLRRWARSASRCGHADRCGADGAVPPDEGPAPGRDHLGINRGANLAEDVTYSGTVSAAMEGALAGVRSIALSQVYAREGMGDTVPFAAAEALGAARARAIAAAPTSPGTLVNVNFPALAPEEVKGIKVVRQGIRDYGRTRIVQRTDPRGYPLLLDAHLHDRHRLCRPGVGSLLRRLRP
jgi:5'-nucleotidase